MDFSQKKGALDNPHDIVFNRKLDTALRDSFADDFYAECKNNNLTRDNIPLYNSKLLLDKDRSHWLTTPEHYAVFLRKIYEPIDNISHYKSIRNLKRIDPILEKVIEVQMHYIHSNNETYVKSSTLKYMRRWFYNVKTPDVVIRLLLMVEHFNKIVTKSNQTHHPRFNKMTQEEYTSEMHKINNYKIEEMNTVFIWNKDICFIISDADTWICPKTVILMYHNKICDLISVYLQALYSQGNNMPCDAVEIIDGFIKCLISMMIKYKAFVFDILKCLEGLCIAETLRKHEPWRNIEFLTMITNDLEEKTKFIYDTSDLQMFLTTVDTAMRHELACLSKIMGHPVVSMSKGSYSLFRKTHDRMPVDLEKLQTCISYFKRDYIKKYISRKGKWPPVIFTTDLVNQALRTSYIYNKDPDSYFIVSKFGLVQISDYIHIDLLPNMSFNDLENIIPYLKDKTITLLRTEVMKRYIEGSDFKSDWNETRLLLAYLLNSTSKYNVTNYLERYKSSEDLDDLLTYLVIRVVPKEKELKTDYRGFGCKTFLDRHRCLAQEKNAATFLEEFSDEQAMTLSELSLLKKLDAFRRLNEAYQNHTTLYIVVDASAWNNHFSSLSVDYFMQETLDKIFNCPIFSKTHLAYEKTLVYVPDKTKTYWWEGQYGGIEGLNQYTWVCTYLSQIKVALSDLPFKYHILCKGDDLRIAVMIPNQYIANNNVGTIKNDIVKRISETMKDFGHKINIEESYGSTQYFAFSKAASLNRILLPQTLRKIQKCYGANNAFINSLDDYIASSFSNAHSAAYTCPNVLPCYAVAIWWASSYLLSHTGYTELSDEQISALLMTPSIVGGFPIIFLHNFYVRAESDLLSPWIGLLHFCKRSFPSIYNEFIKFCYTTEKYPSTLQQLYRDPYSIPITRPALPSNILRSTIAPILRKHSKNEHLRELFRTIDNDFVDLFIRLLGSANVIRAKILSSLFACSPLGVIEELTRKFESGKSILELLILKTNRRNSIRVLRRLMNADNKLQLWRINRIKSSYNSSYERCFVSKIDDCPSRSAFRIREFCWGKPVYDITMPPLQHQIILTYSADTYMNDWYNRHHFNLYYEAPTEYLTIDRREQYSTGNQKPFIGYTTKTGLINPTMSFVEHDVLLKKVQNLLDLGGWVNQEKTMPDGSVIVSNGLDLIKKLIRAYTTTDYQTLSPFGGTRRSGTSQHHMRAPNFRESIIPNMLNNIYTRFKGESNSHISLRTSTAHYTINFLHVYTWCCWLGFNELEFNSISTTPSNLWAVTTPCDYCNIPIEETPIVFDQELLRRFYVPLMNIMAIGAVAEDIIKRSIAEIIDWRPNVIEDEHSLPDRIYHKGIFQEVFNKTYLEKRRLQDRFTQHTLTPSGKNILSILTGGSERSNIGVTEAKSVSIAELESFLIGIILECIPRECQPANKQQIEKWLNTTPTYEIPWYGLVEWIYTSGRLIHLIKRIERHTGLNSTASYYNTGSASRYLGLVSYKYLEKENPDVNLVLLSHYTTDNISRYIGSVIRTKRITMINDVVDWEVARTVLHRLRRTTPEAVKTPLSIMIICGFLIYFGIDDSEESIIDMALRVEENKMEELNLGDYTELDVAALTNVITGLTIDENIHYILRRLLHMLMKLTSKGYEHQLTIEEYLDMYYESALEYMEIRNLSFDVRIHYTNLTDCIMRVRATRENSHLDDLVDDVLDTEFNRGLSLDVPDFTLHINIKNLSRYSIRIRRENLSASMRNPVYIHVREVNLGKLVPFEGYFYKQYGVSNSSSGILLEFIDNVYKAFRLPDGQNYICLCDGIGGFTNAIETCTQNSRILFHTYPDNPDMDYVPGSVNFNSPRNNTIIYDYINHGYYRIIEHSTQRYILNSVDEALLITCDAEIPFDNTDYLKTFTISLSYLINERCALNGMCFLRSDLRNLPVILKLIEYFMQQFQVIYVYQPMSETVSYACYIILFRRQSIKSESIRVIANFFQRTPSLRLTGLLNNFTMAINNRVTRIIDQCWHSKINLTYLRNQHIIGLRDRFPTYPVSLFMNVFGISIDPVIIRQDSRLYTRSANITDVLKEKWPISVKHLLDHYKKALDEGITFYHKGQTWNPDTRAHRTTLLSKLFCALGYTHALNLYVGMDQPYALNGPRIWNDIRKNYLALSPRDRLDVDGFVNNIEARQLGDNYLIADFIRGINVFIAIYGWISMIDDTKQHYLDGTFAADDDENQNENDYLE